MNNKKRIHESIFWLDDTRKMKSLLNSQGRKSIAERMEFLWRNRNQK